VALFCVFVPLTTHVYPVARYSTRNICSLRLNHGLFVDLYKTDRYPEIQIGIML
jgi:hypothetical protein